jgi:hypothetical protein
MAGGIQSFVIANVALVVPFLYGLVAMARAPRVGSRYGVVLAAAGVGAFAIHAWFLMKGRSEFRVPASIGVLVATLVTSLGLGWQSIRALRERVEVQPSS